MQGWIISSTGYGSLITMLFSGYIADVYGPRLVCFVALIVYTIITLLSPLLSDLNYFAFLASRIVMGLADVRNYFTIVISTRL
jgi:MFS family permease